MPSGEEFAAEETRAAREGLSWERWGSGYPEPPALVSESLCPAIAPKELLH